MPFGNNGNESQASCILNYLPLNCYKLPISTKWDGSVRVHEHAYIHTCMCIQKFGSSLEML